MTFIQEQTLIKRKPKTKDNLINIILIILRCIKGNNKNWQEIQFLVLILFKVLKIIFFNNMFIVSKYHICQKCITVQKSSN